jgi:hypothetical protein
MSDGGVWDGDDPDDIDIPDIDVDSEPSDNGHGDDAEDTDDSGDGGLLSRVDRPERDHSILGSMAASTISLIPKPLLGVRGTLYKRLAIKGIENYYKTSGGDAIAINAQAGQQVALEPVKYRSPEQVDEGEKPGWKVKGREKVWNPAKEGNTVNYLGRTPTVLLEDDEHVEAGWLAPRIGQAIEMEQWWPLFHVDQMNAVIDANPTGQQGQPLADGGMNIDLELDNPGEWMGDNIIDLNSGDGYDGMRISSAKAREWQAEHADSESMQMQEDRGYLRGLANGDETNVTRLFLYAAIFCIVVIAVVVLGPKLIGSSGGASGINPLLAVPTGL